jgi:hypothetical protein
MPGDSLDHVLSKPTKMIGKVEWRLTKRFGSHFREDNDTLAHGKQDDFHSCGIVSANTIAHNVFGDPLWNASNKTLERVSWFNTISRSHARAVSSLRHE